MIPRKPQPRAADTSPTNNPLIPPPPNIWSPHKVQAISMVASFPGFTLNIEAMVQVRYGVILASISNAARATVITCLQSPWKELNRPSVCAIQTRAQWKCAPGRDYCYVNCPNDFQSHTATQQQEVLWPIKFLKCICLWTQKSLVQMPSILLHEVECFFITSWETILT